MDTEGFELDVIAIILLRRVRKRRFKKTLENNGFVLYLKRGNRKMQNRKTFNNTNIGIFYNFYKIFTFS